MTSTTTEFLPVTEEFRALSGVEIGLVAGGGHYSSGGGGGTPPALYLPGYSNAVAYTTGYGQSNASAASSPGYVSISLASAASNDPGTAYAFALAQA